MPDDHSSGAGTLMTVCGPVDPADMGFTLPHEHLLIRHTEPEVMLTDPDLAATELRAFADAGGGTVVEVTSVGIGRDPESLRRISEETGVHVVMGASYYKHKWHPPEMDRLSVGAIESEIVTDITSGVGGTGVCSGDTRVRAGDTRVRAGDTRVRAGDTRVCAGVIGEVGVTDALEGNERKVVIASARAQVRTGAAVNFHVHLLDKPAEEDLRTQVMDLIEAEGADLDRVVMSHFEPANESLDYHERIARRGVYIEYDLFGMAAMQGPEVPDYRMEAEVFRQLIDRGLLERLLISQDVCFRKLLVANGGWGYAHILNHVIPRFRSHGITEQEIRTITVDNPRRVFPIPFASR